MATSPENRSIRPLSSILGDISIKEKKFSRGMKTTVTTYQFIYNTPD